MKKCKCCGTNLENDNTYCNFYEGLDDDLIIRYYCKECETFCGSKVKSIDELDHHEQICYFLYLTCGQAVEDND